MRRRLPAALRERDYARPVIAIVAMGFGREMVLVAVGWQVYAIDRNPLHLGLVGLAEFLPLPLLALPAAALADRLSRAAREREREERREAGLAPSPTSTTYAGSWR